MHPKPHHLGGGGKKPKVHRWDQTGSSVGKDASAGPDHLSSTSGTHLVEERMDSCKFSFDLHTGLWYMHAPGLPTNKACFEKKKVQNHPQLFMEVKANCLKK